MPYPNIALSPPYPAAAKLSLAVPTLVTSAATTPVLDTRLVNETRVLPSLPNPNIALSLPYPAAARVFLAVPTPEISVATTPRLFTRLVILVISPNPNIAFVGAAGGAAVVVVVVPGPAVVVVVVPYPGRVPVQVVGVTVKPNDLSAPDDNVTNPQELASFEVDG